MLHKKAEIKTAQAAWAAQVEADKAEADAAAEAEARQASTDFAARERGVQLSQPASAAHASSSEAAIAALKAGKCLPTTAAAAQPALKVCHALPWH